MLCKNCRNGSLWIKEFCKDWVPHSWAQGNKAWSWDKIVPSFEDSFVFSMDKSSKCKICSDTGGHTTTQSPCTTVSFKSEKCHEILHDLRKLLIAASCTPPTLVLTQTPFAPTVVSPITTCAGGVFPSTRWCRYQTYTWVTCTVWWCFFGVVVTNYIYHSAAMWGVQQASSVLDSM